MIPQEGIAFVLFTARKCGLCKTFCANLEEAGINVPVVEIDGFEFPDIRDEHDVVSAPTFIVFNDGEEIKRIEGVRTSEFLKDFFNEILPHSSS